MSIPRPAHHRAITPRFVVTGAARVVTFLERVFDAKVVDRYDAPDGSLINADLLIGDTVIMGGEPLMGGPAMPASMSYYVADAPAVDATFARALEAGATAVNAPHDQPWGYRSATVKDWGGNLWTISAIVEVVSHDEVVRRMAG